MKLHMTQEVHDKFWAYIDNIDKEIGGFGYVRIDGDSWIWHDIFIVEQEVSGGSVDYTPAGIASAIERAAEDGVLGAVDHAWVVWHSHVNMNAYWSSTDVEDQIHKFRDMSGLPWLFSVVGNKRRDYSARLDLWDHALVPAITFDKVELHTLADPAVREAVQADIDSLVTTKTWSKTGPNTPTKAVTRYAPDPRFDDLDDDDEFVQGKDGTWRRESKQHEVSIDDILDSEWWDDVDWHDEDSVKTAIALVDACGYSFSDVLDADVEKQFIQDAQEVTP